MNDSIGSSPGSFEIEKHLGQARRFRGGRIALHFLMELTGWLLLLLVVSLVSNQPSILADELQVGLSTVLLAGIGTLAKLIGARRLEKMGASGLAMIAARPSRWLGHTWVHWTLLLGLAMALAVGLPIGTLMAFADPASELVRGSRFLTVVAFVGLTLIWSIPAAFAIRFNFLRHRRQFQ